jgi:hypothetical protein
MYRPPKLDRVPEELRKAVMRDYNARVIRLWRSPRALLAGGAAVVGLLCAAWLGLFDLLPSGPMRPAFAGAIAGGVGVLAIMLALAEPMRSSYRKAMADNGVCPACGRGIRGTPGSCPDCGATVKGSK